VTNGETFRSVLSECHTSFLHAFKEVLKGYFEFYISVCFYSEPVLLCILSSQMCVPVRHSSVGTDNKMLYPKVGILGTENLKLEIMKEF
jgi:hypothetical protein